MANKITTFFSFQEEGNGLKRIAQNVKEVDGAWNKAKVGFKSGVEEFRKSNAAQAGAILGLGVAAKKAIDASSNLTESVNAVTVTYGDASEAVLALGDDSAQSFGMSQRAFNEFATQFSAFANQIAESDGRNVADVVQEMTTRIADFASVHNVSLEEAARIAQSTLAGETEAFRRYGGDVSAATVKTYAYANGIAEAGTELTEGQKVLARYGAFMDQTNDIANDFRNTSDSLANSQKILAAESENAQAAMGEGLAPALAKAEQGLIALVEAADKLKVFDAISLGWAEDLGTALGQVLTPWKRAAREANETIVENAKQAEQAVAGFNMQLLDGITDGKEARRVTDEYVNSLVGIEEPGLVAAGIMAKWGEANREAAKETEEAGKVIEDSMSDAADIIESQIDGAITEFERYGSSVEKWREDNEAAAEAAAEAQEEFRSRVEEAMAGATSSVFNFSEETLQDVDAWQQEMLTKTWELGKWQNNLLEIASKTSTDFATYLAGMGEAGMDLVNELAESDDELQESFDIWKGTTEVAARDMVSLFEYIGSAGPAGLAAGLKANWWQVDSAMASQMDATMREAKRRWGVQSPSEVFAEEIGEPVAQGIAEGIERDGHKIADELRDQLEDARDVAEDVAESIVDAAEDKLSGLWDDINDRESFKDATQGVLEAQRDLDKELMKVEAAEAEGEPPDTQAVADAREKLRKANLRLFKELIESNDTISRGPLLDQIRNVGQAAGLSVSEIDRIVGAKNAIGAAEGQAASALATADQTAAPIVAKLDELIAAIGGNPDATRLSGGYTINLNGFANEQSIQMLIDAINEVRRREAGAA